MTNQKNVEAGSTRRKRMTAKRKQEAIKRVDRGEPVELVARSFDVSAADVGRWMKKADYAALGALKDSEEDGRDLEIKELQSKVGELIMLLELRDEKIERLETGRPLVRFEVRAMSFVVSASEKKPYGVDRVCKGWKMSSTTVYRHLKKASQTSEGPPSGPRRRPGPDGMMPDAQMVEAIEQVIKDSPFHGEGYRKMHARLKSKGIGTSPARVLRLMRENDLLAKSCRGPAHGPRAHDGTIIPSKVDEMWGTDMTTTVLTTGEHVPFLRFFR